MNKYELALVVSAKVEDEEILNKVFEIFKEKFKDDFDFVINQID